MYLHSIEEFAQSSRLLPAGQAWSTSGSTKRICSPSQTGGRQRRTATVRLAVLFCQDPQAPVRGGGHAVSQTADPRSRNSLARGGRTPHPVRRQSAASDLASHPL